MCIGESGAMEVKIIPLPAASNNPGDTYKRFDFITTIPQGALQETDIFKRALEAERRVLGRVLINNQPAPTENASDEA
jgi:hypothetical protein